MFYGVLKRWLGPGVRRALRQVLAEARMQRLHRASMRLAKRLPETRRLHLGCSESIRPGWVNVDLYESGADLRLDLREPLPFPDASASLIYSEHFLEHLDYPREVEHVLRESFRVLTPGGRFSVGVPDAARSVHLYMSGDRDAYARFAASNPNYPEWLRVPMQALNYTFRQFGEHKYAWDEEILGMALEAAGFVMVRRREFDPHLDSPHRRDGTLYMDGLKPRSDRSETP